MKKHSFASMLFILLALPASTNYTLHDYGLGAGGGGDLTSSTYALNAIIGQTDGGQLTSTTFAVGPGLEFTQQSNVPNTPTFTNPSNSYNKLKIVLDTGNNATDTKFAIAISTDNFVTTNYIKSDTTVGTTLTLSDYQTYTNWGGAAGTLVIGLTPNTTYKVKVKALQGKYTETAYSPTASATTISPTISYDIDVSATDQETAAPYALNLGTLIPGSVVTSAQKIWIDLDTNGSGGGFVYAYSTNNGLKSTSTNYTISSVTGDLTGQAEGVGMQSNSVTQGSGGPLVASAPYNGSSNTVGSVTTTSQTVFSSSASPIIAGRGSIVLKAKVSTVTPSANDYTDVITMIASAVF